MKRSEYDEFLKRLNGYDENTRLLYLSAIKELSKLYRHIEFNPEKPFYFSDYKNVSAQQAAIMRELQSNLYNALKQNMLDEWDNSHAATDKLVTAKLKSYARDSRFKKYFARNDEAVHAFFSRVNSEGLNLSQRVWRNTSQFKEEIEMAFDVALREGKSAASLSRIIRDHLQEPDKLFRRVRNIHGELHLSKRAKAYHPGQGVYRSSYMNSLRLSATQTNISYREADFQRWQNIDFMVGYEIRRSPTRKYGCPMCDDLAGRYPKSFKFVGWHPWCRCYAVPIMMSDEEYDIYIQNMLHGEQSNIDSVNEVKDLPQTFKDYINQNQETILAASSTPYFVRDNLKPFKKDGLMYIRDDLVDLKKVYTLNEDNLKARKYRIHGDMKTYYNEFIKGYNFEQFDDDLSNIANRYGLEITTKNISAQKDGITVIYLGKNNFNLTRFYQKGTVKHDNFMMPVEQQGKGASKDIIRILYKQYKKAGIKQIELYANLEVGGYTWGRYGFSAHKVDAESLIREGLTKSRINQQQYDDAMKTFKLYFKNRKAASFPMNLLAEKTYGKQLLLGSEWKGILDLTDNVQRKVFEDYSLSRKAK